MSVYQTPKAKRVLPVGTEFQFNGRKYVLLTSTKDEYCEAKRDDGVVEKFWSRRVAVVA
jgi:hypothetical protein